MPRKAVVLLNLGGPDSLEAVQPFLYNLFSDPFIISLPLGFLIQKPLARYIAKRRSPGVRSQYERIGGKSPIRDWTEKQRSMLENKLQEQDDSIDVFVAMRYWKPSTEETVGQIKHYDYSKIVLLPLYPHYSIATTGSSVADWEKFYSGDAEIVTVNDYYVNPEYIAAINQRIDESLTRFPESVRNEVHLTFSAHGTPVKLVTAGDPYKEQIEASVQAVMELRKRDLEHSLCFQSKVGPEQWLKPATDTMIEDLAKSGKKHLLIIPISFASDHIETLFELDIEYRHTADRVTIENYIVMKGLNDSELFVSALAGLAAGKLT